MMRLFVLSILLLITLGSAQDDAQASPASKDYQSGFARGLELGMEVAGLQGAASFNPEAADLYNQTVLEFNLVLDEVFGKDSNLSNLYRLQLYGLKANNTANLIDKQVVEDAFADNATNENTTAENMTAVNTITDNITADNVTAMKTALENSTAENLTIEQGQPLKNETINAINKTSGAEEPAIPKLIDNATIAMGDSITDDFGDIIMNWDAGSETAPESMFIMPGPQPI
jgi:hypothetical protein